MTPTFSKCFETPATIVAKATAVKYKKGANDAPTITRTAGIFATVTPVAGTEWVNYGCRDGVTDLTGKKTPVVSGALNVDKCIKACNDDTTAAYTFAALRAVGGVTTCQCGTAVVTGSTVIDMEKCNNPCTDTTTQQLCGPDNTGQALIYAKGGGGAGNSWSASWVAQFSSTPLYKCGGKLDGVLW